MWEITIQKFKWDDKKGFSRASTSRIHFVDTKEKLQDILSGISYVHELVKVEVIYKAR